MSRWRWLPLLITLLLMLQVPVAQAAEPGSSFSWSVGRVHRAYTTFTYGQGGYVATGALTGLWLSPDGRTWAALPNSERIPFQQVLFHEEELLMAMQGGLYRTQPDGLVQVLEVSRVDRLQEAGGRLFAVAPEGWYTSPDGIDWTELAERAPHPVVHANGVWVGLNFRTTGVLRSVDGEHWAKVELSPLPNVVALGAAGERFVAVVEEGPNEYRLLLSSDGESWSPTEIRYDSFPTMRTSNGRIMVVARPAGAVESHLHISSDGLHWTSSPMPMDNRIADLQFIQDGYVALTHSGALLRSEDGLKWTILDSAARGELRSVTWGAGKFIAVGEYGSILSSPDGVAWRPEFAGTQATFLSVEWAGDQFVAATQTLDGGACYERGDCRSRVYTSKDGFKWDSTEIASGGLSAIAWGNGRYVAVDFGERPQISTDGRSWRKAPKAPGSLYEVTYLNGEFLALGYRDQKFWLYRSTDGESWTEHAQPADRKEPPALAVLNDHFILHSAADQVHYSVDGETWAPRPKFGPQILQVTAGGPWYVGTVTTTPGSGMGLSYSPDGAIWFETVQLPANIYDLSYGAGRFVAVGEGGMILHWQIRPADAAPCEVPFGDVNERLCSVVKFGLERKAVGGYPDGSFRPDQGITRAEFTKVLGGVFTWQTEPAEELSFSDIAGHWAATGGFIQPAVRRGALSGFPDGSFQPDAPLTRAQLVKVALAAYGLTPLEDPRFAAEAWYTGWYARAASVNLFGHAAKQALWVEGPLDPERPATRAEALTILYNLMHAGLK